MRYSVLVQENCKIKKQMCTIFPDQSSNQEGSNLAQGLSLAYERRVTMEADVKEVQENLESEQSLEDLMNQMKQL